MQAFLIGGHLRKSEALYPICAWEQGRSNSAVGRVLKIMSRLDSSHRHHLDFMVILEAWRLELQSSRRSGGTPVFMEPGLVGLQL